MHSSGSMARKFGPSWKQSTGQTSTQSMYLHLMQFSVTTNVIRLPQRGMRMPSSTHGGHAAAPHIVPRPLTAGESAAGRAPQPPVDSGEMMRLAPGSLVLEVAPQRVVRARKGDVVPGNVRRGYQRHLQAFGTRSETGRGEGGTEEDVHLFGMQDVHDTEQ